MPLKIDSLLVEKAKERLAVLVCANVIGEEKCPQFAIGKSRKPRGFPNDPEKLPVTYRNTKNA